MARRWPAAGLSARSVLTQDRKPIGFDSIEEAILGGKYPQEIVVHPKLIKVAEMALQKLGAQDILLGTDDSCPLYQVMVI